MVQAKNKEAGAAVPADVPAKMEKEYLKNYRLATAGSGRLMLFAADQKIEHLNVDFFGPGIHPDDADPQHLFEIASQANSGVMAVQFGLLSKYGDDFKGVNYLVKLNSKTNLLKEEQKDPYSALLTSVEQVVDLKKESKLKIVGVGYTIYLGSEFENEMLAIASQIVHRAHQNGLLAVLWMYPRGRAIRDEKDPHLIAGGVGVAVSLGADFVKINCPKKEQEMKPFFEEAVKAGGRTKIICSGGESIEPERFLEILKKQLQFGASGAATGRNIHQKSTREAVQMAKTIYSIVTEGRRADPGSLRAVSGFRVVLVRHGESVYNRDNLFTGWIDVGLSEKGREEAKMAGRLLKQSGFVFDIAFTSQLKRAQETLDIILKELGQGSIKIEKTWRLNERHYGALQGKNKAKIREQYGAEKFFTWRRSFRTPPPPDPTQKPQTECLKDVFDRAVPYWQKEIASRIQQGKRVLIVSHGSVMRALSKYFDNISDKDIEHLNIPTGFPLIYQFDKNLKALAHHYLGVPQKVSQAAQKIARQGQT